MGLQIDKKKFFDSVRKTLFNDSLNQGQVDGINIILDYATNESIQDLSYKLATTKWETAHTMQPISEYGKKSYFNKYEPNTKIGKTLGNIEKGDGYKYRGRGFVMLTGRENYRKASELLGIDLVSNPDRANEPEIAVRILFLGMKDGWFTGKGIGDYIDGIDEEDEEDYIEFVNSRRVVNGTDKAEEIAKIALLFEDALLEATEVPATTIPDKTETPATELPTLPNDVFGWLVFLFKLLMGFFKK